MERYLGLKTVEQAGLKRRSGPILWTNEHEMQGIQENSLSNLGMDDSDAAS